MKKNLLFFILFIFVCHVFSLAPPHPQMGAAGIDSFLQKKAFFENNTFGNLNNLMNFSPGLNSSPIRTALPVWEGEIKLIVIPLQFSDVTFTNVAELYDNIDNNIFSMTNENSLANFYFKSSFGKVTVVPAIITDVVTSEKPMSYYGLADDYDYANRPQWGSPDEIAKHALSLAYETDDDFKTIVDNPASNPISIIDLNGDGMITGIESLPTPPDKVFVMVIHAGGAQEVNSDIKERIWSHQWVINICNNTDVFTGKGNDPNYTLSKSKIIGESVSVFLTYDESIKQNLSLNQDYVINNNIIQIINNEILPIYSNEKITVNYNHFFTLGDNNLEFFNYSTFAELNIPEGSPASIACHEFAHQLGASDIYNNNKTGSHGMGYWSLMAMGVWNGYYKIGGDTITTHWWGTDFDIYHKYIFGWVDPIILNDLAEGTHEIILNSSSNLENTPTDMVARYNLNDSGTQYYLFGVRSGHYYDKYLLDTTEIEYGMTILHVDETKKLSGEDYYLSFNFSERTDTTHPGVWMLRADNRADSKGDLNDLYPITSNNSFTPTSIPSSYGYSTFNAPIIKNITRESDSRISFDFINQKKFIAAFAQNPLDNNYIHVFFRPNFDFNSNILKFDILDSDDNTIISDITQRLNWVFKGNFRFSDLPADNTFKIKAKAYDNLANIIAQDTVVFNFENTENTGASFAVATEYNLSDEFKINSSSPLLIWDNNENYGNENFIMNKTVNIIGNNSSILLNNTDDDPKKGVYVLNNNNFEFIENSFNLSGSRIIGIFEDRENPEIIKNNNIEFAVNDLYSGIKSVSVKDFSGREYSYFQNNNFFTLKAPAYDDFYVEAVDFAGNKSVKLIRLSPGVSILKSGSYPNPASDYAVFDYTLDAAAGAVLNIFDVSGRKIYSYVNNAGNYTFLWDLCDRRGRRVANGVYIWEISTGKTKTRGKIAVLK